MIRSTGFYVERASWLYRIDPRVRLAISVVGIALSVVTARLDILLAVLVLTHLLLILGRVPLSALAIAWRTLLPLLLIITILQPLVAPGDGPTLWAWGPIRITEAGLLSGLSYALRMGAAAFALLITIITTPIPLLVRALEKLGMPYRWGLLIGLALQYLGQLNGLYTSILEAQQTRGLALNKRGLWARVTHFVPTLVALIIASLRLSESLTLGLAARGFSMPVRQRTYLHDIHMRPVDWLALTLTVAGLAASVAYITFV